MRIGLGQLGQQLQQGLAPVYLLSGDEPQQMMEAADAVRHAARQQGYDERELMTADRDFDWQTLTSASDTLSLFSEQRIIDLRMPSGKPGREGSEALRQYVARPPEDTILLIQSGKLDQAALKSSWAKALEQAGVLVQVWPLDLVQTRDWVSQRMRDKGMHPSKEAAAFIAERVEGNLIAAAQEIDKLLLLHGPVAMDLDTVLETIADQARYNVFDLVDTLDSGDTRRAIHLLEGLKGEGIEPPVVLWAIVRELRTLSYCHHASRQGIPLEQSLNKERVWNNRKPLLRKALERLGAEQCDALLVRCSALDKSIKGVGTGDPWVELLELVACFCDNCLFEQAAIVNS
jgi:DNA polymerase-3 subunit delta